MTRMTLGVLLAASFALGTPAAALQTRVSSSTQLPDSVVELRRMLEQMTMAQRALVLDIQRESAALRRASSESERQSARASLAGLYDRLERTLSELNLAQTHLQALCLSRPGPDGWLGINFNADLDAAASAVSTSFVFKTYPRIISVEPDSPAEKAGLVSGDEIVSLGERDMISGALDIAALLKPGARLPVRYRRDGALRSLFVVVEPRPAGYVAACPWIDIAMGPPALAMQPKIRILRGTPNGFGFAFVDSGGLVTAMPRVAVSPGGRIAGTPELPPTPYAPMRIAGVIGGNELVAGAVLIPLTPDAREGLGVDEGILVIDVLRGSPALEAGLRAGDVIVSVNGRKATSIPELKRVLDTVRDGTWELKVTRRNAKPRIVLLRPQ